MARQVEFGAANLLSYNAAAKQPQPCNVGDVAESNEVLKQQLAAEAVAVGKLMQLLGSSRHDVQAAG